MVLPMDPLPMNPTVVMFSASFRALLSAAPGPRAATPPPRRTTPSARPPSSRKVAHWQVPGDGTAWGEFCGAWNASDRGRARGVHPTAAFDAVFVGEGITVTRRPDWNRGGRP